MIRKAISITMSVCMLLMCTPGGGEALDVEGQYTSPETIATQSIRGDEIISPYHVTGESLVQLVQKMADFDVAGANIIFNRRTAQLFVRNTPTNHELIESILTDLRKAQSQQIEIEARIISVSSTDLDDLGLDFLGVDSTYTNDGVTYGTDSSFNDNTYQTNIDFPDVVDSGGTSIGGQFGFAALNSNVDLEAYIDALQSRAVVNTLSAPRLMVANNQRANIKIERAQYYIQSVSIDADASEVAVDPKVGIAQSGTILDVTPTINTDGTISLELHPQFVTADLSNTQQVDVSELIADAFQPTVTLPVFSIQEADTTVTIENGGVAMIGGLIEERETKGFYKVPLLGDIPYIGKLCFQNNQVKEEKVHLVIFVKATIKDTKKSHLL